jgi:hypothetical protein
MEEGAPRSMSVAGPSVPEATTLNQSPLLQKGAVSRRKFSFPAALHSTLLGLHDPAREQDTAAISARRRFSNVSDAVSRKLSHTLGRYRQGNSI